MTPTLQAPPTPRPVLQSHRLSDVHRHKDLYRCKQPRLYKKPKQKQPRALDRKQQNKDLTLQFIKS